MARKTAAHRSTAAPASEVAEAQPKPSSKPSSKYSRFSRSSTGAPFYTSEKFWGTIVTIVLLFTTLFATAYYRVAPVNMDIVDTWAAQNIDQQGLNYMANLIRQQYPSLPDDQLYSEASKRWSQYKSTNAPQLETQRAIIAAQLRHSYQYELADGTSQTYLFEMDPYFWLQKAINYADHGSVCEVGSKVLPNGYCVDAKRHTPQGLEDRIDIQVYLESVLIRLSGVAHNVPAAVPAVFLLPIFLMLIGVIPAFFIGRRIAGNIGGFIGAMMIALHPVILNRTVAGWADTDAYSVIFPLYAIWFSLEAFSARQYWSRIVLGALAGLMIGLFSFAWGGWWFTFFIVAISFIVFMIYELARIVYRRIRHGAAGHKWLTDLRALVPFLIVFAVFFVTSALFVSLFASLNNFLYAFAAPFNSYSSIQAATASTNLGWPNILTTVAELNVPSLSAIIGSFGGTLVVTLAFFGLFVMMLDPKALRLREIGAAIVAFIYYYVLIANGPSANGGVGLPSLLFVALLILPLLVLVLWHFLREDDLDLRASVFIMGWLLASFIAATRGVRFIFQGIPPFALGFGIALGWLFIVAVTWLRKHIDWPLTINAFAGVALLLIVFNPFVSSGPLARAQAVGLQQAPSINDAWWESMQFLSKQTPTDTIVTSWWDFGHWFRNIGNRSVTFDGASQDPEPGHWVGHILLTNDEREAIGVLRMLNCGQNKAFATAVKTLDVVHAKDLINELVMLDRAGAKARLELSNLPSEDQAIVLEATHCTPRPQVFITSADMIGKAGVWGHFGAWDFRRSMAAIAANTQSQDDAIKTIQSYGFTADQAQSLYFDIRSLPSDSSTNSWISGWPSYITTTMRGCSPISSANETNGSITENTPYSCSIMQGVGNVPQGTIAIESTVFRPSRPQDAVIGFGLFSSANQKVGGIPPVRPSRIVFADLDAHTMTSFTNNQTNAPAGLYVPSLLIAKSTVHSDVPSQDGAVQYRVLMADSTQIDSVFTQLYFLDGAFNPHFTKASVQTEPGGGIITIWNVTWPQD